MEEQIPISPSPEIIETPPPAAVPEKKSLNWKPLFIVAALVLLISGVGAGYYFLSVKNPEPVPSPAPVLAQPQAQPELILSLTSPTMDSVLDSNLLKVSGVTLPDTPVVLLTEDHDNTIQSNDAGIFEGEIELESGINTLTVIAMGENGEEKVISREVVYDDQVLGESTIVSKFDTTGKTSGKKFVANDIETLTKMYKVDKKTKYVDEKNKPIPTTKVKQNSKALAILEDEISTPAGLLKKAVKILVRSATDSAQIQASKRQAVHGVITEISGSVIRLAHQVQRERQSSVTVTDLTKFVVKGVDNPTLAQIQVGQRIIVTGNLSPAGDIIATRVYVIPGKASGIFSRQPVTPYPTLTPLPTSVSTPSATPATTLSPTPSPTLTPTPTPSPTPSPTVTPEPSPSSVP